MLLAVALLTAIGAGTVGGVFFAFSTFVMKALGGLPVNQGVAAMQRINVVVLNGQLLGLFVGTALTSVACIGVSFFAASPPLSAMLLAGGLLYLCGSFIVTIAFNVPRNNHLAALAAESAEAAAYWPVYVREWLRWNHVRTLASIASAACSATALAY